MVYYFTRGALIRALLGALILSMTSAALVQADAGVAIDIGKIAVNQRLSKGGSYQLPVIGVRNPGSEPSTYTLDVSFLQGQSGRHVPPGWLTFAPEQFRLEPGATQPVRVTLDIPTRARPDDYAALLNVRVAPAGHGAQVGAAAATQLTFTVKPSSLAEAWLLRGRTALDDAAPWPHLLTLILVFAVLIWWLRRRFHLDVQLQRRR